MLQNQIGIDNSDVPLHSAYRQIQLAKNEEEKKRKQEKFEQIIQVTYLNLGNYFNKYITFG